MPYRLAHFSDFHLTDVDEDFYCSVAMIDDAIEQDADHPVISGDIVESGQMDVVEECMSALRQRRRATARRLTLIPSNHAIFPFSRRVVPPMRRPTAIFEEFVALTRCSRSETSVRSLMRGEPYPFGKILHEDVVLAGMDTTPNGKLNSMCWAEGELPEHHMEAVDGYLARHAHAKYRIVVMHHHPWEEALYGGRWIEQNFTNPPPGEVEAWLRKSGAALVLCGHFHGRVRIEIRRFGRRCRVLRSGTAGGVDDEYEDGEKLRSYHLIDLESSGRIRITRRAFWDSEL